MELFDLLDELLPSCAPSGLSRRTA
jgi:hypothetical protein